MKNKFLTLEEIEAISPAAVEREAAPRVSERYSHVPTIQIIEDMAKLGWGVTDVKTVKAKKRNPRFGKHMVIFRNDDVVMKSDDGEVVYPQILLSNSHDGLGAFKFRSGLFRVVCSNGLVVSTKDFGQMSLRHRGYCFEELQKSMITFVKDLPKVVETLNKFKELTLTEEQQIEFALAAIGVRFGEGKATVEPLDIIKPVRKEDEGSTLWTVFNTIQEKITGAGFSYTTGKGKTRQARNITNFNQDTKLNEQLYELAEAYVN